MGAHITQAGYIAHVLWSAFTLPAEVRQVIITIAAIPLLQAYKACNRTAAEQLYGICYYFALLKYLLAG